MTFNYLDIIIGIILIIFGIAGLRKGFIIEIASLLALFLGIYGAMTLSDFTAEQLVKFINIKQEYLNTIAFIVTFIILVILINLLGKLLSKVAESISLGGFDKIGGFLFGALKGVLLVSLLIMVLNAFHLSGIIKQESKEQSLLYPYVEKTVPYVYKGFDLVQEAFQNYSDTEDDTTQNDITL